MCLQDGVPHCVHKEIPGDAGLKTLSTLQQQVRGTCASALIFLPKHVFIVFVFFLLSRSSQCMDRVLDFQFYNIIIFCQPRSVQLPAMKFGTIKKLSVSQVSQVNCSELQPGY